VRNRERKGIEFLNFQPHGSIYGSSTAGVRVLKDRAACPPCENLAKLQPVLPSMSKFAAMPRQVYSGSCVRGMPAISTENLKHTSLNDVDVGDCRMGTAHDEQNMLLTSGISLDLMMCRGSISRHSTAS